MSLRLQVLIAGVHFENVESLLSDEAVLLQGTEELPHRTPRGVEEAT